MPAETGSSRSSGQPPAPRWAHFARDVIAATACGRAVQEVDAGGLAAAPHGGVFVTLYKFRRLRGCMGVLDTALPLPEAVRQAAVCAARHDPRFEPVGPGELRDLEIEVSVMSAPRLLAGLDELELGVHGILVRRGRCRGLFLPQVAVEHHLGKEEFLSRCCAEKAGLPTDAWRDPQTEVLVFTTEVFRE
ncbi:MAG: AmmeMemoRadiSam system protein A [Planctomycetota bacterium]